MIDRGPPQAWLPKPRLQVFYDPQGEPEGAFLQLTTGKQRRREQPVPPTQVFLCWGFDGYPLAVSLLEPAAEVAQRAIVERLFAGPAHQGEVAQGAPPIGFKDATLRELASACEALRRRQTPPGGQRVVPTGAASRAGPPAA
jgi:hypothetical protein